MSERMDDQQASAPAASGSRAEESAALRNWQLANGVTVMDSAYEYDEVEQNEMRSAKPWQKDPHYFKEVTSLFPYLILGVSL